MTKPKKKDTYKNDILQTDGNVSDSGTKRPYIFNTISEEDEYKKNGKLKMKTILYGFNTKKESKSPEKKEGLK